MVSLELISIASRGFMPHHNLTALPPFAVEEFHRFSSHPGEERAVYRIEARFPLTAEP